MSDQDTATIATDLSEYCPGHAGDDHQLNTGGIGDSYFCNGTCGEARDAYAEEHDVDPQTVKVIVTDGIARADATHAISLEEALRGAEALRAARRALRSLGDAGVSSASVTVPVATFGAWLATVEATEFHVCRRGKVDDEDLHAFWAGHLAPGRYLQVHTHAADLLGHEVPAPNPDLQYVNVPAAEAIALVPFPDAVVEAPLENRLAELITADEPTDGLAPFAERMRDAWMAEIESAPIAPPEVSP